MFVRYYGQKGRKGVNWELIVSRTESEALMIREFDMIMHHTRWVLDHLETLPSYRIVSDKAYATMINQQTKYYKNRKV